MPDFKTIKEDKFCKLEFKTCSKCNSKLPATRDYFHLKNNKLSASCKECNNRQNRENYYKKQEERKEYARQYNETHAEWKANYMKDYYIENKEKFSYEVKDKEKFKLYQHNYRKSEQGKTIHKYHQRKRRHLKHKITKEEWNSCKLFFNNSCAYCGKSESQQREECGGKDLHKEHVIDDGRNDLKNCVPSCQSCNSRKYNNSLNNWYNLNNTVYSYERYHRIYEWLHHGYKDYIKQKRKSKNKIPA
jgi:hypothetical protein